MATRTALITGTSRGLGLALAKQISKDRWALIVDAPGQAALAGLVELGEGLAKAIHLAT